MHFGRMPAVLIQMVELREGVELGIKGEVKE